MFHLFPVFSALDSKTTAYMAMQGSERFGHWIFAGHSNIVAYRGPSCLYGITVEIAQFTQDEQIVCSQTMPQKFCPYSRLLIQKFAQEVQAFTFWEYKTYKFNKVHDHSFSQRGDKFSPDDYTIFFIQNQIGIPASTVLSIIAIGSRNNQSLENWECDALLRPGIDFQFTVTSRSGHGKLFFQHPIVILYYFTIYYHYRVSIDEKYKRL